MNNITIRSSTILEYKFNYRKAALQRNQFYFSKRSCLFSFWDSLFAIITFSDNLLSRRPSEIASTRGDTNVYPYVCTHPAHPPHPPRRVLRLVPASRAKYVYFFHLCIQLFPIDMYTSISSPICISFLKRRSRYPCITCSGQLRDFDIVFERQIG